MIITDHVDKRLLNHSAVTYKTITLSESPTYTSSEKSVDLLQIAFAMSIFNSSA